MLSRQKIRNEMREQRRSLTSQQQDVAARAIQRQLIRMPAFRQAKRIACYLANDGEIDLSVVIAQIRLMKKQCYLPVLAPLGPRRLWFAPLSRCSRMCVNRFGIPEPMMSARDYASASELDLILLPLVAFDGSGNRLGMGGGFYDRTLAYLNRRDHWKKPQLLGVAHDLQRVDSLDSASWDIPLNGIITDQRVYQVSRC